MAELKRSRNESDVREDIAMPFLKALGYETGTPNDIVREKTLTYEKDFLGRKKKDDPPLRGRADYILAVAGAGSWTLEIKAENIEIDINAIEQAITYARHPEVSGSYAAILNGKRIVVFHNTQRSTDTALIDLAIENPLELAKALESTLSPLAIRQDCSPPVVDLAEPLAPGFRSNTKISKASIVYDKFTWRCNRDIPKEASDSLTETCRRMSGLTVSATGGSMKRDSQSRIRAQLDWVFPNNFLKKFAQEKVGEMEYISLSQTISDDPLKPTIFHVVGKMRIESGDSVFDIVSWDTKFADIDGVMAYNGQATGFLKDGVFQGAVEARYETIFPKIPGLQIAQTGTGKCEIHLVR